MIALARGHDVLAAALAARACSAVVAEAGRAAGPLWTFVGGRLSLAAGSAAVEAGTIFDLASLTKAIGIASLAAKLVAEAQLDLDCPVATLLSSWRGADRVAVTVRDLLEHCSGLPAHRPYFETMAGRAEFERALGREPLETPPRTAAVYSDLGFLLLGFVLEDLGGAPLNVQFARWRDEEGLAGPLAYRPPPDWRPRTASTGFDPWRGRVLHGEVHDGNAAALDGVAAHAGLFGTAAAVGEIARWWLARVAGRGPAGSPASVAPPIAAAFVRPSTVPGSSRALGWDTMRPTSSCGRSLSPAAFGHTGFTGTSLWIDPGQDLYIVLLSNYVEAASERATIRSIRRAFHEAVVEDLRGMQP